MLSCVTNIHNVRNFIGPEEYNIDRSVLSVSILYSLSKKQQQHNNIGFLRENRNPLINSLIKFNNLAGSFFFTHPLLVLS